MANISLDYSTNKLFKKDNTTKSYTFKDIGTNNFKLYKVPAEDNEFDTITKVYDANTSNIDQAAIKTALTNLFMFRPGQEILEPKFGNELYMYLYEPMNAMTANKIIKTIYQMINTWEPRISITDIPIVSDEDNNTYYIKIIYSIPQLHTEDTYEFGLTRNGVIL